MADFRVKATKRSNVVIEGTGFMLEIEFFPRFILLEQIADYDSKWLMHKQNSTRLVVNVAFLLVWESFPIFFYSEPFSTLDKII